MAVALSIAWVRAFGEFGAVVVTAYYPSGMPVQLWVNLQSFGLPADAAAGSLFGGCFRFLSSWSMCWHNDDAMLNAHIVKKRREMIVDVSLKLESGEALGCLESASGAGQEHRIGVYRRDRRTRRRFCESG